MNIRIRKPWELPESAALSETDYVDRRRFVKAMGLGAGALLGGAIAKGATGGFPSILNSAFKGEGLDQTPYDLVTGYNNFYEFSTDKSGPAKLANKGWETEPWTIEIGGLVDKSLKFDVNELIKAMGGIEQRVYRFRCVEAWSMVIPWDGFALKKLVELAQPKASAKFLKFTTFLDKESAPGQRGHSIRWPYVEALTIDEANNDLAFLATGVYGKPIPNQNGAPIRLVVPWKYGFKSIKSIVRIDFVDKRPVNSWQDLAPREYGFYANVNPNAPHPRWSQSSERVIGGGFFSGRQDTLMFNGYEKEVAHLYDGLDLTRNF